MISECALVHNMCPTAVKWLLESTMVKDQMNRLYQGVPGAKRGLTHKFEAEL